MGSKRNKIRKILKKSTKFNAHQLASCYGKIRYNNYEAAKRAASDKPDIVHAYKCKYCKYYHIGRKKV